MKKSFMTRVLATGLSLAMAFSLTAATNVSVASAAAKPAMKSSKMTVKVGESKNYQAKKETQKAFKITKVKMSAAGQTKAKVTVNSSKKSIKVEGLAPTKSSNVVIYFKNNKTKKTTKVTTKVVVKAVEEKPVDSFEMTSLVATSANELTATFATAVASSGAVTIKVNKQGSTTTITGTPKWSDDLTSVVFTAAANFTAGTYEMTATDAADATKTTSKTAVVENEKVADIVIKGDTALTDSTKKKAYVYYDVLNQYGESIRTSVSINWTVSSGNEPKIDKAVGKITATKSDSTEFTYGSYLYVTGVYNKTGVTVQKQLTIGMEQSLDTVKTAGFVKDTDKNKIIDKLPANFQKGQYYLAFEALDQNENPIDVNTVAAGTDVTFISDNVLLMTNDFKTPSKFKTLTIDGVEYGVVTVEPGQYVDKGGEVNITAISNKTGKKTIMNYVIGATPILKSVVLSQPASVVADGESATIPYTAYDTEGNSITNYESIARTTNSLNLTAGEGSLTLYENNDGTARFVWDDITIPWTHSSTKDEIDRSVALATVVVGGESNNMILSVSDKARPVAVKSVTLRDGATTAIVAEDEDELSLSDFTFVDQYGRTMTGDNGFFDVASKDGWNNEYYAVKATFNKTYSNFVLNKTVTEGAILLATGGAIGRAAGTAVSWSAIKCTEVKNETVKYAVVSNKDKDKDVTAFDNVGKELNVSYSVVPMKDVSNISINKTKKQYIKLGLGEYKTAAEAGYVASDLTISLGSLNTEATGVGHKNINTTETAMVYGDYQQTIGLSGAYNGVKLVVPAKYVEFSANKFDLAGTNGKITGAAVSTDAIKLGDFYDATAANLVRKDGSDTITAKVYTVTRGAVTSFGSITYQHAAPSATLTFSDAMPAPAEVKLCGTECTTNPNNTEIDNTRLVNHGIIYKSNGDQSFETWGAPKHKAPWVVDQYGVTMSEGSSGVGVRWLFNVSAIEENAGEFAHLDKSFVVNSNDTATASISGAELGDKYTLTLTAFNDYGSAKGSIKITVGADDQAKISDSTDYDKTFRKNKLHYAY